MSLPVDAPFQLTSPDALQKQANYSDIRKAAKDSGCVSSKSAKRIRILRVDLQNSLNWNERADLHAM